MPRKARKYSSTGIYHIVIKGLDSQVLFEDAKDYNKYIDIISTYKEECDFSIYAYCLMSNHVHIIIKINSQPLDLIFKKINTTYAIWFNMKYKRNGHLQQDRFYSEPVEDMKYLLAAIRYVHQNPSKAGIEHFPGETYKWSSVYEYLNNTPLLTDIIEVQQYIPRNNIIEPPNEQSDIKCLDIDTSRKRIPDDVARDIILDISHCSNATEFQKLPTLTRNAYILKIHEQGVSIRQLNRLTGTSTGHIQRILKKH